MKTDIDFAGFAKKLLKKKKDSAHFDEQVRIKSGASAKEKHDKAAEEMCEDGESKKEAKEGGWIKTTSLKENKYVTGK